MITAKARVLLDTDCNTDCGDVGALAVLHALADLGEVDILGVGICVSNPDVPGAVAAINAYYGRSGIPVGRYVGDPPVEPTGHAFVAAVRDLCPDALKAPPLDTTRLYRSILRHQPDASVTVVAIGFMNTVRQLLESSADDSSPLSGRDLVRAKVGKLVVMGGQYPDSSSITPLGGAEYNFYSTPKDAALVCESWPTPIVFCGFEVGEPILAGRLLAHTPSENPVRRAYEVYGHAATGRSAWDEATVFYAVRGAKCAGVQYFEEVHGTNKVTPTTGGNRFAQGPGRHAYLRKCLPDNRYAAEFDALQAKLPAHRPV